MSYIELHCHSAYSFLDGASHPEEPAARAAELGYEALALTDHDGVYGLLEFAHAAKFAGIRPITGAEVALEGGAHLTLLCESGKGYANPAGSSPPPMREPKPEGKEHRVLLPPAVPLETVAELNDGLVCLSGCARDGLALRDPRGSGAARRRLRPRAVLRRAPAAVRARRCGRASRRAPRLAEHLGVETVATGNVHAHAPRRTLLQDTLVAIRCRTSLDACERERRGNREAVLRSPAEMVERFAGIDCAAAVRTERSPSGSHSISPRSSATGIRLLRPRRPRDPTADRDLRPGVRRALSRK